MLSWCILQTPILGFLVNSKIQLISYRAFTSGLDTISGAKVISASSVPQVELETFCASLFGWSSCLCSLASVCETNFIWSCTGSFDYTWMRTALNITLKASLSLFIISVSQMRKLKLKEIKDLTIKDIGDMMEAERWIRMFDSRGLLRSSLFKQTIS